MRACCDPVVTADVNRDALHRYSWRVIYLSGCIPSKQHLRDSLLEHSVGAMLTPYSQRNAPEEWTWAADNGCFSSRWDEGAWLSWLSSKESPQDALFATVPDVVADHHGTRARWEQYHSIVRDLGYRPAFVLQDGAHVDDLPWDTMGALFIGGTTDMKLSDLARSIVDEARARGKWVHMGRVNSRRRIQIAFEWGCDSVDGTYLAFAPDFNTPRLIDMLREGTRQLSLF